jgi:flagellar motor switch protein FliG
MDSRKLAGPLKVALLIKSLDEKSSDKVLGTFSPSEQEKIKRLMPQLNAIPVEVIDKVAKDFIEQARGIEKKSAADQYDRDYARDDSVNISGARPTGRLGVARFMDKEQLVQLIQDEHPQTLALILSYLDTEAASDILAHLPPSLRADVALRIAKLGRVNPWMLDEIEAYLSSSEKERVPSDMKAVGGVGQLAGILKKLDGEIADTIMEHIESSDDDLADEVNQMLFVFDDIVLVDDRGMQQLLRNVETQDLALALKAASGEAQDKIFNNMSSRASAMLTEEIDSMGPVRMADVTQAQQKIIQVIQEMEKKGELIISGQGGDEFIG